jgi:hypothetical protein
MKLRVERNYSRLRFISRLKTSFHAFSVIEIRLMLYVASRLLHERAEHTLDRDFLS